MLTKKSRFVLPKVPLHDISVEYQLSKNLTQQIKKKYDGDDLALRYNIKNYQVKSALKEVTSSLKKNKEETLVARQQLDKEWTILAGKEQDLRDNFIKFHGFVNENINKRGRALVRLEEQKKVKETRTEQLENLKENYENLQIMHEEMSLKIDEYTIYERYLQKVCEEFAEFPTTSDLLKRYESLIFAKKTLAHVQDRNLNTLEQTRHELINLIQTQSTKIRILKNKLSEIRTKHEESKQNCTKWERICHDIKRESAKKLLEKTSIEEASNQLYLQVCYRRNLPINKKLHLERKLQFIKDVLSEVTYVNKKARRVLNKQNKQSHLVTKS